MARATGRAVCGFFAQSLERHGVPEEILTDNGKVFTNRFGLTPTEVLFDKICRDNGIVHRLTAPASPTTTGKIERFHRTLRQEFLGGQIFPSLLIAQKELDTWVHDYNTERPHQGIAMATPPERFGAAQDRAVPDLSADLRVVTEDRSGEGWVNRTVSVNGTISVSNQVFSVGKQRGGHIVDVRILENLLEVWDGPELIKNVLRTTRREVRKKKAERH